MGFDNTVDNRWRPDFESSRRRVQEEEADVPVVQSRELSFVPDSRPKKLEAHDAQTRALIERHVQLCQLKHGTAIVDRLSAWNVMDRMRDAAEKQRYLDPLFAEVQRDPIAHEDTLIFLLIVLEPIRRNLSKRYVAIRSGLVAPVTDLNFSNRAEARMVREIDRQAVFDVTRQAALEAIFRYPANGTKKLWPWFRETIAWRVVDTFKRELEEHQSERIESTTMQAALSGLADAEPPDMRDQRVWLRHRSQLSVRDTYEQVEGFFDDDRVRRICSDAVGRLPQAQREIVDLLYFKAFTPEQAAEHRGVARSTIYNADRHAKGNLNRDDLFVGALLGLKIVRDEARRRAMTERYPSGRTPDGRRFVHIDDAA